jgi:hypothetical protein
MSNEQKRFIITKAYPGDMWAAKVAKMSDAQVHSVYMRLLLNDRLKGIPLK